MRIRSWWVWSATVGGSEVNTRRNEGVDFCAFAVEQTTKDRVMQQSGFPIDKLWCFHV